MINIVAFLFPNEAIYVRFKEDGTYREVGNIPASKRMEFEYGLNCVDEVALIKFEVPEDLTDAMALYEKYCVGNLRSEVFIGELLKIDLKQIN